MGVGNEHTPRPHCPSFALTPIMPHAPRPWLSTTLEALGFPYVEHDAQGNPRLATLPDVRIPSAAAIDAAERLLEETGLRESLRACLPAVRPGRAS
jgi:hypothetical protein